MRKNRVYSLKLNRACDFSDKILDYVKSMNWNDTSYNPVVLSSSSKFKVVKLEIPGCGKCVLKETVLDTSATISKKISYLWRILVKDGFRRTFKVTLTLNKIGISTYVPYASWISNKDGIKAYFLCQFVEGDSFESICKKMQYSVEDRELVLGYFKKLGEIAAFMHSNGIVNLDMIPQNCIMRGNLKEGLELILIDLDLGFFVKRLGKRYAFIRHMWSFRRFVTFYPLNDECLMALLESYCNKNGLSSIRCREVLEFFRKVQKQRKIDFYKAVFLFSPLIKEGNHDDTNQN